MTATLNPSPTTTSTKTPALWRIGVKAGLIAAAATTGIAVVANAAGVSFESAPGEAIPFAGFAQLTLFFTAIGVLIARVISNRSNHPQSTFTKTAVALTVLSVVPDVSMSFDAASKLTLMLAHVVAAAIVIPALASQLTHDRR